MKMLLPSTLLMLLLTACEDMPPPQTARDVQEKKAAAAANAIQFTSNAEIDNIKKRLELTSDPGLTGFVLLMNEAGQPIMYTGVSGKITSGGKRLTEPERLQRGNGGERYTDYRMPATSDEGTFGSSGEYVYFWTTDGQYIQWNGKYLYSDKPFRTKVEPLVVKVQ